MRFEELHDLNKRNLDIYTMGTTFFGMDINPLVKSLLFNWPRLCVDESLTCSSLFSGKQKLVSSATLREIRQDRG